MEERYKTLAAEGVRNIDQYNRNIRAAAAERPPVRMSRCRSRCRTSSWSSTSWRT